MKLCKYAKPSDHRDFSPHMWCDCLKAHIYQWNLNTDSPCHNDGFGCKMIWMEMQLEILKKKSEEEMGGGDHT